MYLFSLVGQEEDFMFPDSKIQLKGKLLKPGSNAVKESFSRYLALTRYNDYKT